jgi:hypothetical protein
LQRQLSTLDLSPLLELAASQGLKRCAAWATQETLKSQCE